ncbi:hypothetical protein jhhlp_007830 [Lomentospora prolificans]|uniref:tripeptidyl-peptidase II n=1 Tax=Lomentospora prolificans TaxID=41688 RepID=A0A2N3N0N8_9PEZI|nr:hypothetical protein jhhlp_007830 [Lomentospora prolificans]
MAALLTELFTVEHVAELPAGWTRLSEDPAPTEVLPLSISVRNDEGIEKLKQRLAEISNPKHKDFGKHLSRDEVRALRQPSRERTDAVLAWLEESGIVDAEIHDDWVRVNSTVQGAKDLLGAEIAYYTFPGRPPMLRTRRYGVPAGRVAESVAFIHPLSNFFVKPHESDEEHAERRRREAQEARMDAELQKRQVPDEPINPPEGTTPVEKPPCADETTPDCLRELYNIRYALVEEEAESSDTLYLVAGFLEQNLFHPDTHDFMDKYAPHIPDSVRNISVELINGGTDPQIMSKAGMEAALDVQYALSLSHPVNVMYSITGGRGVKLDANGDPMPENRADNEPYLEFLEYMLEKEDEELPHVISISYADDEQGVPRPYALKVCDLLAALTSRGVSIIGATGDGGSRGVRYGDCRSNDGLKRPITMASFPASCPYVTAIGAVNQVSPPQVATFSTGGFSNYFERPDWQATDVEAYITTLDGRLSGHYNDTGRAIPDISAIGVAFNIYYGGGPGAAMGTSASAPVIASMFALINDARRRKGLGRTGWLNPRLYSEEVRAVVNDVGRISAAVFDGGAGRVPEVGLWDGNWGAGGF